MAVTLNDVESCLKNAGFKYSTADGDKLLLRFKTDSDPVDFVMMLQEGGAFLDMRTVGLGTCPGSHPAFAAVAEVLSTHNYDRPFLRLEWDESDGEIIGRCALPLDGVSSVTDTQVGVLVAALVQGSDRARADFQEAMARGAPQGDGAGSGRLVGGAARSGDRLPKVLLSISVLILSVAVLLGAIWLMTR